MYPFLLSSPDVMHCCSRAARRFAFASLLVGLGLLMAVLPASVAAQGFGVYEQGTCAMGRAGTVAAQTCDDGSAVYYNPAGLTGDPGWTVSGGVTAIFASACPVTAKASDDSLATERLDGYTDMPESLAASA